MRKTIAHLLDTILVLLLAAICFVVSSDKVVAHAASNMVTIRYVYLEEEITSFDVVVGTKLINTIDEKHYEEIALDSQYTLEWHIGTERGEKWSAEFVFMEHTTLVGVAVLKEEVTEQNPPKEPEEDKNTGGSQEGSEEGSEPPDVDNEESGSGGSNGASDAAEQERGENDNIPIYKITVKGGENYTVTGSPQKGERITVLFGDLGQGKINTITVLSNGNPIVFGRNNNEISFYMPDGDVSINCSYCDSENNGKQKLLTTQEIIALSIVGIGALLCGVYVIVRGKLAKKRAKSGAEKGSSKK